MYSLLHLILASLVTAVVVSVAIAVHFRNAQRALNVQLADLTARANEHQKTLHRVEAEQLKARNDLESEHHRELKTARDRHYSEGFEHGVASGQKDHLVELTNVRAAHRDEIATREAEAEKRGRALAKMEHEAQVKAFGVEIRPYVKVEKDAGFIRDDFKSHVGYQYQLLVNGIPAFQPHVVIEQSEEIKEVDKATVESLLKLAHKAADTAAAAYLGGSPSGAFRIGADIVQRV